VTFSFPHEQSLSREQIQRLSPVQLAYIGDGVYELWMRLYHLWPPRRIQTYHQQVVAEVRAENQSQQLESLMPLLNEVEAEMVRRGRNAATGKPKRLSAETYGRASGLETLFGYLYLTNQARLQELLGYLKTDILGPDV
jgi:ribonuclease III family protein